jgi:hypothetical protein
LCYECCGEGRGANERVLASDAGEATANLLAAAWDRRRSARISRGRREEAMRERRQVLCEALGLLPVLKRGG